MRRIIVVLSLATVIGVAMAAGQDESTQGTAYMGLSFGGHRVAPRDFHYGLRLDYGANSRDAYRPAAPLMQFDFTRAGLNSAHLNGLSVLKKSYALKQIEGESPAEEAPAEEAPADQPPTESEVAPEGDAAAAEAPAEEATAAASAEAAPAAAEEGFFARSWHGVKNFFGAGDKPAETETAKTEAPAEETPAENPADVAQGTFMGYNAIDWATLAVGAVGLGFIASEVANNDESKDVKASSTGTATTGGTIGIPTTAAISVLPTGASGLISTGFVGAPDSRLSKELKERIEWLDGGTGHMGDLEPRKN